MESRLNLVTGGSGFIGQHLVRQLAERGERVRVFDIAEPATLPEQAEFKRGTILDREAVEAAVAGAHRVFHLAANPDLWTRHKSDFAEVNHRGTVTVLEAAERAGAERIVHTSTESILRGQLSAAPAAQDEVVNETIVTTISDMPGPYCRSKHLAERAAFDAAARGAPVVVVNPTLPVGPGDHRLTPPTRMIAGFLNGDHPAYLQCTLNMIDVRDAAMGHILAAEKGRIGERYILGNQNIKLSELLKLLHDLSGLGMPKRRVPYWLALAFGAVSELAANAITHRQPAAPLTGVRLARSPMAFDNSKAVRDLGLPVRPLRESIVDALTWLRESGLLERSQTGTASVAANKREAGQAGL